MCIRDRRVINKRCAHHGCTKQASSGRAGGKAEYCRGHAEDGMVDVNYKRCAHGECLLEASVVPVGSERGS